MIIALERNERMPKEKIDEFEQALGHIKRLEGILCFCADFSRIRLRNCEDSNSQSCIKIGYYISNLINMIYS